MKEMTIEVNQKILSVVAGETILDALKRNKIEVPTLCHMKDLFPSGACRMCVVEVEGARNLVPSCSFPVADGMKISTHSQRVVKARKTIIELLLSNHPDDCLYCVRNSQCELQSLAARYNVSQRRISGKKSKLNIDLSSLSIVRDPAKCILCGRCVRVCEEIEGVAAIDFIGRGSRTVIQTAYSKGLNVSSCINCGQCINVCPTGALQEKEDQTEVQAALNNPDKIVVVQHAPSISVTMAEEFGMPAGTDIAGHMNAAFRKMGFKYVFDSSFSADLTIMEESAEFVHRVLNGGTLPLITSCCPGWVKFAEEFYPERLHHLSSCKSPQQMLGALIKSYFAEKMGIRPEDIYTVSVMPCTAKKFESQREEMTYKGIADIDAALTTREMAKLIRLYGIDILKLEPEPADSPLGQRSSAGKIFGASGGVAEAALRTAYFKLTGKEAEKLEFTQIRGNAGRKETIVDVNGTKVGVAVVSGLKAIRDIFAELDAGRNDLHLIEVMACPGGCINGGGQPFVKQEDAIACRMASLYKIDDTETLRVSHRNPDIIEVYEKFLGEPLSHKSHELLHTHYHQRDVLL